MIMQPEEVEDLKYVAVPELLETLARQAEFRDEAYWRVLEREILAR